MDNGVNGMSTKLPVSRKKSGGAPKRNKNAWKHGVNHYRRLLSGDGLKQSTALHHALEEIEEEFIKALGGDPSPQERVIIRDTANHMLYGGSYDAYLKSLKSIVRKGRPHPIVAELRQESVHVRENLKLLGIKRRQKQLSLDEILSEDGEQHEP